MDELDLPEIAASGQLAPEVAERVRAVLAAAEAAAGAVRHEADRAAHMRRRLAEEEAQRYVDEAKRQADAYLQERIKRISELSDGILNRAESIVARLDRAEEVRRQLQGLVVSLGQTAEQLAADAAASYPRVRPLQDSGAPAAAPEAARAPEPEPEPASIAETEPVAEAPAEPEPEPVVEAEPVADAPPPVRAAPEPDEPAGVVELRRSAARDPDDDDQLAARLVALQMAVAGGDRGEVEAHLRQSFDLSDPSAILDDVFGRGTSAGKRVSWPEAADDGA